jgi:hypothetical protein
MDHQTAAKPYEKLKFGLAAPSLHFLFFYLNSLQPQPKRPPTTRPSFPHLLSLFRNSDDVSCEVIAFDFCFFSRRGRLLAYGRQ